MSLMDQHLFECEIGKDYPLPIVDIEKTRKQASEIVWSYRKNSDVKEEGERILKKHTNNSRSFLNEREIND
jgi:deoxyribodipyrimidine photo-lyase